MAINHDPAHASPPPGIKPDYDDVFSVGTEGPIDDETAFRILQVETEHREQRSEIALRQSWIYIQEQEKHIPFTRAYCALREASRLYPITAQNCHSGERIPLIHAWETASEAVLLAFRAHYKSSYQRLREVVELVVLQQFFYTTCDKSIVTAWGRGKRRTPNLRMMLKTCGRNPLYKEASDHLGITENILHAWDDLGAYIHTRGVPATSMGLTGSNTLAFSPDALSRFSGFFLGVARLSILMLAAFFPAGVIPVPAFEKLGHLDPGWLPRKDHVECISSILTQTEQSFLRGLAGKNEWFQRILAKLNRMMALTEEEIDRTYEDLQTAVAEGLEAMQRLLKETNSVLEDEQE